jgi:HK97 family phage portal protein
MSEVGILRSLFEKRTLDENSGWGLITKMRGMNNWETPSGLSVSPQRSIQLTAVWASVRILSEGLASLPLPIYKRLSRGKERDVNHPLYRVLHDQANPLMTSFMWRETMMGHCCTWGNCFSEIESDNAGRIKALWPLRPDQTKMRWVDGKLYYVTTLPESQGGGRVGLPAERVLHIRGLSSDGMLGYSPIREARNALGLAAATEEFGSRFFGNGAKAGGVLEHPGSLSDDAHTRLKSSWNEMHQGLDNSHRVAILEEGMKYNQIGIPPEDAQFLQTRKFQVSEIARIFLIPPHRLADLERATFSNIEQMSLEFVIYTLRPWLVRWEQELLRCLFTETEKKTHFAEFNVDAMLRGDTQSRYQAYHQAWQDGWLTWNEIREKENLNPIDGGDTHYVPLNMIPADKAEDFRSNISMKDLEKRFNVDGVHFLDGPAIEKENSSPGEKRARSAGTRRRLMLSQRPVISEVAERIVKREARDILTTAKKILGKRSLQELQIWLDEYYEEHKDFILGALRGTMTAYAELVAAEAAEEVLLGDLDIEQVRRFVKRYLEALADRHAFDQKTRVNNLLAKALSSGADTYETLENDLSGWDRLAGIFGQEESVRLNGAVSVFVYAAAGVAALYWNSYGESCPYCRSLDGRKVGMQEWFLQIGDVLRPEGADELKVYQNVRHPPAHGGCDCLISAG